MAVTPFADISLSQKSKQQLEVRAKCEYLDCLVNSPGRVETAAGWEITRNVRKKVCDDVRSMGVQLLARSS